MNPYYMMIGIGYILLAVIAVIFYKKISLILKKRIGAMAYPVSVLITVVIPGIMYAIVRLRTIRISAISANVLLSIVVYIILLVITDAFSSIRKGSFSRSDKIYILLYILFSTILIITNIALFRTLGKQYSRIIFMICILQFFLLYFFYTISKRLYEENYNEKEADRLRYKVNSSEEYLENVMLMDRQIKVIKHDMKRQLQILTNLITLEKYDEAAVFLRQYGMSLEKIQDYIHTENAFVNTLINNKIEYARNENIVITSSIHKKIKEIDNYDLCTILGNIIDNAIEAELREEQDKREIEISSFWDDGDCVFRVGNYISQSVLEENKELKTTKTDKKNHGIGTQIIKSLTKKNQCSYDYYEEGSMFYCEIRW